MTLALRVHHRDHLAPQFLRQTQSKGITSPKLNLFFDASPKVRVYAHAGIGFHSNDTRVVVARAGNEILPKAYGIETGLIWKPVPSLMLNIGAWQLDMDQEFVYVGDEAVVEPGGRTRRKGIDLSARWQLSSWLMADVDFNYTHPRAKDEPEGNNYIPLAPTLTSIGGLTARLHGGFYSSMRYRYIADRPANEDNSITAKGQFVMDLLAGWKNEHFEASVSVQNLFDVEYNDAQFETESRLQNEAVPVSELHFTPGSPFFLKGSVSYFF